MRIALLVYGYLCVFRDKVILPLTGRVDNAMFMPAENTSQKAQFVVSFVSRLTSSHDP